MRVGRRGGGRAHEIGELPMKRAQKRKKDEEIGGDVRATLAAMGWILPLSEAEVARAERELAEQGVMLPEGLRDVKAVFEREEREGEVVVRPLPSSGSPYLGATLARAAREGGEITPEVEERMRRDREAAEREADEHGKGE